MNRLITHIKVWNEWRKGNMNSRWYKLQVLFGKESPSYYGVMAGMMVEEELKKYYGEEWKE